MASAVYESVFRSQPDEHATGPLPVRGTLPAELRGTVLRAGPGLLEVGSDTLNFFDGHAQIAGVTFDGGTARFRSRLVRTPLLAEERAAGRLTKRRTFTNLPSRWSNLFALALGNGGMHDVYAFAGKVFAGNDPGHFALDAATLDTLGPESWGGAVGKGEEMSPMPYVDPHTGHLIGWIKTPGGLRPDTLRFVEVDASLRVVRDTGPLPLAAAPVVVHDHRASASHYVAVEQGPRLSVPRAVWGASTVYASFVTPPGGTANLLLAPRSGGRLVRIPLPGVEIAFHVINAYDDGDRVVVDLCTYDGRIHFEGAGSAAHLARTGAVRAASPAPRPRRYVIDPARGAIVESRPLADAPIEAPEVRDDVMGRPYRYCYGPTTAGRDDLPDPGGFFFYGALVRIDATTGATDTWVAPPDTVASPPTFVPRPGGTGEGDGWLLSWLLGPEGASLAVLEADRLPNGPIAEVSLGVHLPGVSHTRWAADVALAGA